MKNKSDIIWRSTSSYNLTFKSWDLIDLKLFPKFSKLFHKKGTSVAKTHLTELYWPKLR